MKRILIGAAIFILLGTTIIYANSKTLKEAIIKQEKENNWRIILSQDDDIESFSFTAGVSTIEVPYGDLNRELNKKQDSGITSPQIISWKGKIRTIPRKIIKKLESEGEIIINYALTDDGKQLIFINRENVHGTWEGEKKVNIYKFDIKEDKISKVVEDIGPSLGEKYGITNIFSFAHNILFRRRNEITVMNLDNLEERSIGKGFHISLSPDGKKIAFQENKYGDYYIMNVDGTGKEVLIDQKKQQYWWERTLGFNIRDDITWSPDSKYIIYRKMTQLLDDMLNDLYIMDVKTKERIRFYRRASVYADIYWGVFDSCVEEGIDFKVVGSTGTIQ